MLTTTISEAPMPRLRLSDEAPITARGHRRPPMTAAEVSAMVGELDLETARAHHVEMTTVVAELARSAGMDWPWTHDDATVSLLRALALMSLVAPDAVSGRAVALQRSVGASATRRHAQVPS